MTGVLWVCLGAAVGAPGRYLVDRAVQARHDSVLPWGTVVVNVVGSFVLGVLLGLASTHDVPDTVLLVVGTGLCGALTTWSTFGYETVRLVEEGAVRHAVVNVAVSLLVGTAAAVCGYALGALG
ncbi:fluoride efflux transporter CrcB [Nocardioides taihuensis]|uniref:Fluoride-specific ion channel FluC n=1 Tax=Nocardioides taihuensis TaxID=1835606 RepID=A0ABW0BHU4_9ACTN